MHATSSVVLRTVHSQLPWALPKAYFCSVCLLTWSLASHRVTMSSPCFILPFNLTSFAPYLPIFQCSSVQLLSHVQLFETPWIAARQASLSITNSRSSLKLTSIESVMPSSHLILGRPLLLLPSSPPSISLLQWVNSSHEVAKVLEFQLWHHSFQRTPRTDLL